MCFTPSWPVIVKTYGSFPDWLLWTKQYTLFSSQHMHTFLKTYLIHSLALWDTASAWHIEQYCLLSSVFLNELTFGTITHLTRLIPLSCLCLILILSVFIWGPVCRIYCYLALWLQIATNWLERNLFGLSFLGYCRIWCDNMAGSVKEGPLPMKV